MNFSGDFCLLQCTPSLHTVKGVQISENYSRVRKKGSFGKAEKSKFFLEILENLGILEILENPQTVENKGESDHFLEILENLEILEILEIPSVRRPLS